MKQWYEQLFENYSKKYDEESFVQGTEGECDFILVVVQADMPSNCLKEDIQLKD